MNFEREIFICCFPSVQHNWQRLKLKVTKRSSRIFRNKLSFFEEATGSEVKCEKEFFVLNISHFFSEFSQKPWKFAVKSFGYKRPSKKFIFIICNLELSKRSSFPNSREVKLSRSAEMANEVSSIVLSLNSGSWQFSSFLESRSYGKKPQWSSFRSSIQTR